MPPRSRIRDSWLIDALEEYPQEPFAGTVWRVVREGRDPRQCSASGGRWDDGSFDVLYTSLERDGAIAEMYFHLLKGQPVFPSKLRYVLYELEVVLGQILRLSSLSELARLGLDISRYGQLSYVERVQEHPRTQEIGEAAYFLDCDALMVPSARWDCANLVLFCDRLGPGSVEVREEHGLIEWAGWAEKIKA